ncbi:hypothetical protein [Enterobacter cloacae]|uniref:hypothetical protein n=1 Tax=Enterobacter cloacae TaxID=550 RepID=UPI0033154AD9
MSTISRERIEEILNNPLKGGLTRGEQMELARIALERIDAKAVALRDERSGSGGISKQPGFNDLPHGTRLYAVPPEPVVPAYDQILESLDSDVRINILENEHVSQASRATYDGMRSAILQGAEPVTTAYKLPEPLKDNRLNSGTEADDYYSGYQAGWNELLEAVSGNSPVITDELIRRIAFSLVYLASDEKVRSDQDALNALVRAGVNEVRKELSAYA